MRKEIFESEEELIDVIKAISDNLNSEKIRISDNENFHMFTWEVSSIYSIQKAQKLGLIKKSSLEEARDQYNKNICTTGSALAYIHELEKRITELENK
jgi:hypothetical protein